MRRFFIDPENIGGANAILSGAEARHISTVLRLAPGTTITLFDGSGSLYEAVVSKVSHTRVEAKIVSLTPYIETAEDSRSALHMAVGVLKGKKMDFIIQKITELGVDSLLPFRSRFCAAHDPAAGKLARWQKIAREACKQCNRPKAPHLHEITDFEKMLGLAQEKEYAVKIIFWEDEKQNSLQEIFHSDHKIESALVLIGPEGGFSSGEVADAMEFGFKPVTLGRKILRAETAVIAAASILQYKLGNLA